MRDNTTEAEAQATFVGLLTHPLVTPSSDPELHRLARRHHRTLAGWAAKCGYRLVTVGDAIRLHRTPIGGEVAHPAIGRPPPRRELVLTLVAAAACEDGDTTTTVQGISDRVRVWSGVTTSGIGSYDPDRRAERVLLVRALERLEWLGVLRRRTHDETLMRRWEDEGGGIGRGYEINRGALLQLVDPATVAAAFAPVPEEPIGTGARLLRRLVETQTVLTVDLSPEEHEWLQPRRGRLADDARRMTGGVVEVRHEGMILILPPERPWSGDATVDWPRPTAASWVALLLLDAVVVEARSNGRIDHGVARIPSRTVDELADQLHVERRRHLTKDLRADATLIRVVAEATLGDVDVVRVEDGGDWLVVPPAARYRDPTIVTSGAGGGDEG